MLRTNLFCVLGVVLPSCSASPQSTPEAELQRFVDFLEAAHPAPFAYADAAALEASVQSERAGLRAAGSIDHASYERALRRVVAAYGDAHMEVGYRNGAQTSFLPILPRRAGAKIFVDAATAELPIGTELLSIEGRPIEALLEEAAAMSSVDGGNSSVQRAEAERRFGLLGRVVLGPRARYDVVVRMPDGAERRLDLPGVGVEGIRALEGARHSGPCLGRTPGASGPWPALSECGPSTMRLRLPTFGVRDANAYGAKVDEIFAELDGDERLVIDLRGNEGGFRTLGIAVLRHLIDRPFAQWERIRTRIRCVPDSFRDRVQFPFAPEAALENFPGERQGAYWVFEGDPFAVEEPASDVHRGEVALLVDDATNSAAIEFATALLKYRDGVTVVGAETQGGCRRHSGELPAVYEFETLPFAVTVSLFDVQHVERPGCENGRGIQPDIVVAYSEQDFLEGRDPFLEALR